MSGEQLNNTKNPAMGLQSPKNKKKSEVKKRQEFKKKEKAAAARELKKQKEAVPLILTILTKEEFTKIKNWIKNIGNGIHIETMTQNNIELLHHFTQVGLVNLTADTQASLEERVNKIKAKKSNAGGGDGAAAAATVPKPTTHSMLLIKAKLSIVSNWNDLLTYLVNLDYHKMVERDVKHAFWLLNNGYGTRIPPSVNITQGDQAGLLDRIKEKLNEQQVLAKDKLEAEKKQKLEKTEVVEIYSAKWGNPLDVAMSGSRVFIFPGFVLNLTLWEALQAFGMQEWEINDMVKYGKEHVSAKEVGCDTVTAVYAYSTEMLFAKLNRAMREKGSEVTLNKFTPYIAHLSKAIACLPLYTGKVFRGIRTKVHLKKGAKVVMPSFTSTTKFLHTAKTFSNNDGSLFVFQPSGNSPYFGKDISDFSKYPNEGEVLFNANTTLEVTEVYDAGKLAVVPGFEGHFLGNRTVVVFTVVS